MARLLGPLFVIVAAGYPLLVYFSLDHLPPAAMALILLALAVTRLALWGRLPGDRLLLVTGIVAMVAVAVITLLSNSKEGLRYYPVVINAAMLVLFAWSLTQPRTIIERLARLFEPELPPEGVAHTRQATWAWCVFFTLNGSIALWTAIAASWEIWTLYNGLIAYILMAMLFAGEYALRQHRKRRLAS